MKPHPNTAFETDMRNLELLILRMGSLVEEAIKGATQAFAGQDVELAQRVVTEDQKIDALEAEINAAVVRMLALRQPAASDLYEVVSVMKVAGDLERLGDYAKNLAKRVPILIRSDRIEGAPAAVRRLSRLVQGMLKDALKAFTDTDIALARSVVDCDVEVDQMTNTLFREFLTHMMEDPRSITACMHLLFIAKNFERMGDHVTEIAEQVIFVETGEQPVLRVKGASTSQIADPLQPDSTTG